LEVELEEVFHDAKDDFIPSSSRRMTKAIEEEKKAE
jgi:hypothetical protein